VLWVISGTHFDEEVFFGVLLLLKRSQKGLRCLKEKDAFVCISYILPESTTESLYLQIKQEMKKRASGSINGQFAQEVSLVAEGSLPSSPQDTSVNDDDIYEESLEDVIKQE
jgi:hypothetical protein